MKSLLIPTLLIAVFSFIVMLIAPWWAIAIAGFGVAIALIESPVKAFFSGFLGVTILWIVLSIFRDSGSSISVAETLGRVMGGVPAYLMFLITGITGGAVGGLGALSGTYARSIILKKQASGQPLE